MKIEHLCDHQSTIPELVDWYASQWKPYYGDAGPGDARADLISRCNCDSLPIGLVAMEGTRVLATAALDLDVSTNLTPSIVGLLVAPDQRRRGIATALFAACENTAFRLGYRRLYVSTSVQGGLLERTGWKAVSSVSFLNNVRGSVFEKELLQAQNCQ